LPAARRIKFVFIGVVLVALAVTAGAMIRLASERHRLTADPLALTSAGDARAACEVLVERSLSGGGSHVKSRFQLQVMLTALRDGKSALPPDAARALLGDLYDLIAARVAAPDAQHRDEMLALLAETRPPAGDAALSERYQQALAKHGIAAAGGR
jgi:hypothetical protein